MGNTSTRAATPTANPDGGAFGSDQSVTLSCDTPGATIWYSENGITPIVGMSSKYTGPIDIQGDGRVVTIMAIATASGYTTSYALNETYSIAYPVTDNSTLTYYNSASGVTGAVPAAVTQATGTTVTVAGAGDLARTGYSFAGWKDYYGTAYAVGSTFTLTKNLALYAQWTVNTYTLTYDANDGAGTIPASVTKPYNGAVTAASAGSLARTGYTFAGWNEASNGSGTPHSTASTFALTKNLTLYAQWSINTYTLSYDANGGTGAVPASVTRNYNVDVTVAGGGGLSLSGYSFAGWNILANGNGTAYVAGSTFTFTANAILYAQWTALPGDGGITVTNPPKVIVSLSGQAATLASSAGMTVQAITSVAVDSYVWRLDGYLIQQGGQCCVLGPSLPLGPHSLMVLVSKDGSSFSASYMFTVQ